MEWKVGKELCIMMKVRTVCKVCTVQCIFYTVYNAYTNAGKGLGRVGWVRRVRYCTVYNAYTNAGIGLGWVG